MCSIVFVTYLQLSFVQGVSWCGPSARCFVYKIIALINKQTKCNRTLQQYGKVVSCELPTNKLRLRDRWSPSLYACQVYVRVLKTDAESYAKQTLGIQPRVLRQMPLLVVALKVSPRPRFKYSRLVCVKPLQKI